MRLAIAAALAVSLAGCASTRETPALAAANPLPRVS